MAGRVEALRIPRSWSTLIVVSTVTIYIQGRTVSSWLIGLRIFALLPVLFIIVAAPLAVVGFALPMLAPADDGPPPSNNLAHTSPETFPHRAYFLDNRIVVGSPQLLASQEFNAGSTTQLDGTLAVSAEVFPARLIVVDGNEDIVAMWSNTGGSATSNHSLTVRTLEKNGPSYPLTDYIVSQYDRLLGEVDWSARGQVYPSTN